MELNLKPRSSRQNDRQTMALRALELGYSTIVWNVAAFGKLTQYKPTPEVVLTSLQMDSIRHRRGLVVPQEPPLTPASLRQLSRLTVSVEDVAEAQQLTISNDTLQQFDIIAATPSNVKVFAHLCKLSDVDIISLDFTHRQSFPINKKLLDCAIQRGISFEIVYAPLFQAPATRRNVISNTKLLLQYLNGRNTIVTSGAEVVSHMRGPQDAVQLGLFLGVPTVKAAKTLREHCSVVIKHAAARKQRYLPLEIVTSKEFEKRWPELSLRTVQSFEPPISVAPCDAADDSIDAGDQEEEDMSVEEDSPSKNGEVPLSDDDVNETDGFISLGGDDDKTSSSADDEPAYKPPSSSSASQKASSFMDKIQQQGKKRRTEKSAEGNDKKIKKAKR